MLISKTMNVVISNRTMSYFDNLGYEIPKKIGARGYPVFVKGSEIEIDIKHALENSKELVKVQCDYCGKIKDEKYCNYANSVKTLNKYACSDCKGLKIKELNKKTVSEYIGYFKNEGYSCISNEQDIVDRKKYKFKLSCSNNHIWEVTYDSFRGCKNGCPECAGIIKKWTYKMACDYLINKGSKMISGEKEFTDAKNSVIKYRCSCGNIDEKRFSAFYETPSCSSCQKRNKYSQKEVDELFRSMNWQLLSIYKNNNTPMDYICERGHKQNITLSNLLKGVRCRKCYNEDNSGENHHNWNHNKKKEDRLDDRKYHEYNVWRKEVFERDNYECQICGDKKGGNLNAHHKDGYNWCKERRTDVSNAVTMCNICHTEFHSKYGYGDNTEQQLIEWIQLRQLNVQNT